MVTSKTSFELWTNLEQQFGSETAAKKVHLKMLLNNLNKRSLIMTEYFSKLRSITDELAIAGSSISNLDFITHLISGLGQLYYPVMVYIEANVLKMSIDEAYSMLLTHEPRLESANSNASKEAKMNYAANLVQTGNNSRKANYNAGWNNNNNNQGNYTGNYGNITEGGNWNGNYGRGNSGARRGGNAGYGTGRGQWNGNQGGNQGRDGFAGFNGNNFVGFNGNGFAAGFNNSGRRSGRGIICQICFKPNHSATECRNKFNQNFVPNPLVQGSFPNQNQGPKAAFMVTSEGVANQG